MTANLVYTYPVQTTAGYTVQFDVESFSQLIESKIWKNGKITVTPFVEKLMSDTTQEMLKSHYMKMLLEGLYRENKLMT